MTQIEISSILSTCIRIYRLVSKERRNRKNSINGNDEMKVIHLSENKTNQTCTYYKVVLMELFNKCDVILVCGWDKNAATSLL